MMGFESLIIGLKVQMLNKNSKVLVTGGSGFIGTNLIDYLIKNNICSVLNIDIKPPQNPTHFKYWSECNILDIENISKIFLSFNPDFVIHLAARTDLDGGHIDDYKANTIGTSNVITCIGKGTSIKNTIFASSMLVNKLGMNSLNLSECTPSTPYGMSKLIAEQIIHSSQLSYWTIVRPTSIWGPWFGPPYRNFFDVLRGGIFLYCKDFNVCKTYGYVENTIFQIVSLLNANKDKINKNTIYLGDNCSYKILEWATEIQELSNFHLIVVPNFIIRFLAKIGDFLQVFRIKFPITSFRYRNMTIANEINLSDIHAISGPLPVGRKEANLRTLRWMDSIFNSKI